MNEFANRIVVYAGPSLPARHPLRREPAQDVLLLPPARRGDLLQLLDRRPAAVVIIDGYYGDMPAVSHAEIRDAIDFGLPVIGAASMGALRAAELASVGMRGIGRIYRFYRYQIIDGDDEVAVLHAPAELGYAPLSIPLVELRITLEALVGAKRIEPLDAAAIVREMKRLPFAERTQAALLQAWLARDRQGRSAEQLRGNIEQCWIAQKTIDAEQALQYARELRGKRNGAKAIEAGVARLCARRTSLAWFHHSAYRQVRQAGRAGQAGAPAVSERALFAVARLLMPAYAVLHRKVLAALAGGPALAPARRGAKLLAQTPIDAALAKSLQAGAPVCAAFLAPNAERYLRASEANSAQKTSPATGAEAARRLSALRTAAGALPGWYFIAALKSSALSRRCLRLTQEAMRLNAAYQAQNWRFPLENIAPEALEQDFLRQRRMSQAQLTEFLRRRGFEDDGDDWIYALRITYLYRKNIQKGRT